MKQVLNRFVTTKGVIGAYILDPENVVFKSEMPSQYNKDKLHQIGRNMVRLTVMARSDFSNPQEISFFFENAVLRIQDFNKGYHFIALFSPNMNRDVLDQATNTFINEFDRAITSPPTLSLVKPLNGGQGRKARVQASDTLSPEDLMRSETLAGPLKTMQSALVKVLGPISKIVFFDALEKWRHLETPCMDSLPSLTNIISEGIGDAVLSKGFKDKLPAFCCSSPHGFSVEKRGKNKFPRKVAQNL